MKIRYALLVALSLSLPSYGQKKQSAKATPQIQRVQQIQRILWIWGVALVLCFFCP